FIARGFDGARMQEIADRAGANKAMIYYYFDSKEALFNAIFSEAFANLVQMFTPVFAAEAVDPQELVPHLVHLHLDFLGKHPEVPRLILREIHSGNPVVEKLIHSHFKRFGHQVQGFRDKLAEAVAAGRIRPVDPLQTMWNLVALNLFIFALQPLLAAAFPEVFKDSEQLLARREEAITDLLLYGLLPR
ncbi:MAG TPA: TetR/AcrR family transcriptional regulator, partial [bacterium]|nr:TetR/AcrR family transcriptional regulator [bacterium]